MNITKAQLIKGFRGEVYNGNEFVGGVYLVNGQGYVLEVSDGQVKNVIGIHSPKAFRKVGSVNLSATRSVTKWELAA
jgi:hypothetical protein